jgi:diguanylate cyclase (GGDEF)-like protein
MLGSCALLVTGPASVFSPLKSLTGQPWIAVMLVVLSGAAVLWPVSFHHRGHTYLFSLSEVPLLLGLVFAAPAVLVLSRVVGEGLVLGAVRRQSPLKLSFNVATAAASASVAASIYRSLPGTHTVGPVGWAAGAAALAAAAIVAQAAVSIVIRLHGQGRSRSAGFDFPRFALVLGASIGLAFVVLDAAWSTTWDVLPLALVGALIVFAYRAYLKLTQRFGALEQLYDFSRSLGGQNLDPADTAWAILEHVQSVLRARRAELVLVDAWPEARSLALDGAVRSRGPLIRLSDASCVTEAISIGQPSLRQRASDRSGGAGEFDAVLGKFRDALVVPLLSGDQAIGALVALDRQEELDPFDDDDLRLFEALAAHASTTLERARLVEELRFEAESKSYQATHDSLTGLPNRALFLERAAAALAETGRAAVALLDLDRFKEVNDTLGHSTGDKLVCEVAECLVRAAHGRATVARLGGDEFALIVPDIIGPEEAIGIVRDLEDALSKPMSVDGITLAVRASAGVALAPEHGDNVSLLLQRADIAMYLAKERHSGIELYSPSLEQNMERKLVLGGQLAQALQQGRELYLMYQPIASLDTGELLRFEALARWNHPELGQIPAEEFIGIAEQMGLIGEITEFVLTNACAQAASWRDAGMPFGLSVNLSGRDLSDKSLVEKVSGHLRANDLPASSLTLEVTETEVMADIGEASGVLGELGKLGVRIAVDDFGTGYSSLAYLHRLPLNELKIDRSFAGNVAYDESNAIIVRSSIAMAHSLGLSVVAEGAEDELTCAVLADAGCDAVQGYYFAKPLDTSVLQQWLRMRPRLDFSRELLPPLRVIEGQGASPRHVETARRGHDDIGQIIS